MGGSIKGWWTAGEDGAVAVYRAHLLEPLLGVAAICALTYWWLPNTSGHVWYFVCEWIACAVPLTIRHRRAAIFTKDEFILRPVFGPLIRVPLVGVKDAGWFKCRRQIRLRLDLFVGERIEMPFHVRSLDEIVKRLRCPHGPCPALN